MRCHSLSRLVAPILVALVTSVASAQPKKAESTVGAVVECSLPSASGHIRQFAFDRDAGTYFASAKNAGAADHFTLRFDKPVAVKSIAVTTGKPAGGDVLADGMLEVSADGIKFEALAKFADGKASAKPDGQKIQAVRVKPALDLKHPLTFASSPSSPIRRWPSSNTPSSSFSMFLMRRR
jgi:hypothetical protein